MCLQAEISTSPCMVHSDAIEKNKVISYGNVVVKKERRGDSCLHSWLLLLLTVKECGGGGGSPDWVGGCQAS